MANANGWMTNVRTNRFDKLRAPPSPLRLRSSAHPSHSHGGRWAIARPA